MSLLQPRLFQVLIDSPTFLHFHNLLHISRFGPEIVPVDEQVFANLHACKIYLQFCIAVAHCRCHNSFQNQRIPAGDKYVSFDWAWNAELRRVEVTEVSRLLALHLMLQVAQLTPLVWLYLLLIKPDTASLETPSSSAFPRLRTLSQMHLPGARICEHNL